MFTFKVKDKEYKIKFSINAMAENDLMDRVQSLFQMMEEDGTVKIVRELALTIRELIYVGSQKYNPIESVEEAGNVFDDYFDEHKEQGDTDITTTFFGMFVKDLQDEGFMGDLLETMMKNQKVEKKKK